MSFSIIGLIVTLNINVIYAECCGGATTLSMTTFSIMTLIIRGLFVSLRIMTLGITTFSIMTLSIRGLFVTLSIMTLSITRLYVPLSIRDSQHNNALP